MSGDHPNRNTVKRFLTNSLLEEERQQLEESLLWDDALFRCLEEAEEDFLDAWARGKLPQGEAQQLETTLAASLDGQARLEVARSLQESRQHLFHLASRHKGLPKWLPLVACLLLTVATGWLGMALWEETMEVAKLSNALGPEVEVDLRVRRSEIQSPQEVELPADATLVQLRVSLKGVPRSDRYRVKLGVPGSEAVYSAILHAPGGSFTPDSVTVPVPVNSFVEVHHELTLEGFVDSKWVWLGQRQIEIVQPEF